jgi:hypothetical protein
MKENPITFSLSMIQAILPGTKTQTRKIIIPQPVISDDGIWYPSNHHNNKLHYANENHLRKGLAIDFCPYGQPGDRLWVQKGDEMGTEHLHTLRQESIVTLEIIAIRAERVQDISKYIEDEGIRFDNNLFSGIKLKEKILPKFIEHWDYIHTNDYSWDNNPWVWVINFKQVEDK